MSDAVAFVLLVLLWFGLVALTYCAVWIGRDI